MMTNCLSACKASREWILRRSVRTACIVQRGPAHAGGARMQQGVRDCPQV